MKKRISEGELSSKLFFHLLPIQILLALVHAVNGTISGLFASNCVGPTAMSAMELYAPAAALAGTVSTVLVGGALLLCGKYLGKGQMEETQKVFSTDLVLTVLFSGLLMGAMLLISAANLTDAFTGDPGVQQHFRQYLLGQMVGVLPLMLSQQLSAFLPLENQSRRTITASSKGWEPGMGERKNHAKQTKTELYFVEPGLRAESFAERLRRKQARRRHHR